MTKMRFCFAVALAALAASVPAVRADTWTASGSGSDGALDASAVFTVSAGEIQVTITNLLSAATIISIGQAVSDLSFTLSNAPGTDTSNTAVGQLADVANVKKGPQGVVTDVSGAPDRWISSKTGGFKINGDTVLLEAIGHGSPTELILPSGSSYPDSNASIDGHSPNVDGPATFTLDLTGVTTSTTISDVKFSFGTGPDTDINGTKSGTSTVPEPSAVLMLGFDCLGLAGLTFAFRRRLKKE
jgi:hypothetical protein